MRGDLLGASDYELLRSARSDEDAFGVFYRRYERLIAGWLVRRTGRPDLAAELTAEVFAAAYLAADRFRDRPEPAAAWLLGIARNKLLKSLRRERAEATSRRRLGIERIAVADERLAALENPRHRRSGAARRAAARPPTDPVALPLLAPAAAARANAAAKSGG